MDRAGVPANSELRRIESIFFPEVFERFLIRILLRSSFLPRPPFLTPSFLGGKRVDEEAQPPTKDKSSEDTLTIRDVVSRAKDAESKSKV